MSSKIVFESFDEYDLGDIVSFDHDGERLTGKVVRVYNARDFYHVEVNGQRYQVSFEDNLRRE